MISASASAVIGGVLKSKLDKGATRQIRRGSPKKGVKDRAEVVDRLGDRQAALGQRIVLEQDLNAAPRPTFSVLQVPLKGFRHQSG